MYLAAREIDYSADYWPATVRSSILQADMDGSNCRTIIEMAAGFIPHIAIDHSQLRLFWTNSASRTIKSTNLEGGDEKIVVQLSPSVHHPSGLTFLNDRMYWAENGPVAVKTRSPASLRSSNKAGQDVRTLSTEEKYTIDDLTFVGPSSLSTTRVNHCEEQDCSTNICVLTPTSFRCVA